MEKISLFAIFSMSVSFNSVFAEVEADHFELRNAVAKDYFNPETHLNLAKYHYDKKEKLCLF